VSFGRHTNSVGSVDFVPQTATTLGGDNAGPRVGPVVLNEIQFAPPAGELAFVELRNATGQDVPLYDPAFPTNRWRIGGLGFEFPPGTVLHAGALALVTPASAAQFRQQYGISADIAVFSAAGGQLQRTGERLELLRPDAPESSTNGDGTVSVSVPYVVVDAVRYNDRAPWPAEAASGATSLERRVPLAWGDDPAAWRAAPGGVSPGSLTAGNRPPRVDAGADREFSATAFPLAVALAGTATDDGLPDPPAGVTLRWSQISGPPGAVFDDSGRSNAAVELPGQGIYLLRLTASDGERETSDDVQLTVSRPGVSGTLVKFGSTWKYQDSGTDLGTAWRAPGYDDTKWKSGPARLGFGGDGEVMTIDGGPSGARYPTVYFRLKFDAPGVPTSDLNLQVTRDDGVIVWLNGTEVYRSNMPDGEATFATWASSAIGGTDETTPLAATVAASALAAGSNTLAIELHQANAGSSDLGLDVSLDGAFSGGNAAPTADAGPDLSVTLPAAAALRGRFSDDGLPAVPGVPAFVWSKVSGPGTVNFGNAASPATSATFGAAGDYILKFAVNDGASSASDTVTVRVLPGTIEAPVLTAVAGNPVKLRFGAAAGVTYQARYRTDLAAGAWQKLADIPAGAARTVELPDAASDAQRFYQVVQVLQ
jgi:hypothetical protein